MIELEHVVLASPEQMEFIIEGMRNPMNSHDRSDSKKGGYYIRREYGDPCSWYRIDDPDEDDLNDECVEWVEDDSSYKLGTNDHSLMQRLANAGTDHRKFMRMMPVYVRITAPLYWWKEFDTYKVGTVANSCSTMHKIQENEFTLEDFSTEHLINRWRLEDIIDELNKCRYYYNNYDGLDDHFKSNYSKKDFWWQMIQLLPSSYNQTRNVMLNYEVLANIYKSRKNHKLDEWREFCKWIEELPYNELICGPEFLRKDFNIPLVDVTRCKDCKNYISGKDMKNNEMYKDYNNVLGHDGLCMNTDKWTDEIDFCSDGKKNED